MSDQIETGDVVWAVRDCCGMYLGRPFTVSAVVQAEHCLCESCGYRGWNQTVAYNVDGHQSIIGCLPVAWLRKLTPPAGEIETQREMEIV